VFNESVSDAVQQFVPGGSQGFLLRQNLDRTIADQRKRNWFGCWRALETLLQALRTIRMEGRAVAEQTAVANPRKSVAERAAARASIANAKLGHSQARLELDEQLNRFSRLEPEFERPQVRPRAPGGISGIFSWLFSGSRKNDAQSPPLPRKLVLEKGAVEWRAASRSIVEEVEEKASTRRESAWTKERSIFWLNGPQFSHATKNVLGFPLLRITTTMDVPPIAILVSQLRTSFQGEVDETLQFADVQFKFGSETRLCYSVRQPGVAFSRLRDFVELYSFKENADGSIVIAARSVLNLDADAGKGFVRATTHIFGLYIEPREIVSRSIFGGNEKKVGSTVTLLSCVDQGGWMPGFAFRRAHRKNLAKMLLNTEKLCLKLVKEGNLDELIEKYVYEGDVPV